MTTADLQIVYRDPAALRAYGRNSRTHTAEQIAAIRRSIDEFGFVNPILLKDDQATIGAGHARLSAAMLDPPLERVPTVLLEGLTDAQWRAYVIADNRLAEQGSGWDFEALRLEFADLKLEGFDLTLTGFDEVDFDPKPADDPGPTLMERFGVAPFSVLSAREGWWQDRKRAWIALGIQSELGRGDSVSFNDNAQATAGTKAHHKRSASPGDPPRPAADYSGKARGDGAGRTLGAVAPNQKTILKRKGSYAPKGRRRGPKA